MVNGVNAIAMALLVASAVAACDTVDSSYATLADARADRLFERGWLPDVLPSSTTRILTANQIDLDYSTGSFRFHPGEAPDFIAVMRPPAPFEDREEDARVRIADGATAHSHWTDDSIWVFFCRLEEGKCEYVMWLERTRHSRFDGEAMS